MKRINILCPDNKAGLSRDANIIQHLLDQHYDVGWIDPRKHPVQQADLNLHLEILYGTYTKSAKVNVFIPNPEWFYNEWRQHISKVDHVIAKTYDTQRIFERMKLNTVYTSFTSEDRYIHGIEKTNTFFHSSGKSLIKGTEQTLQAFNDPTMPKLFHVSATSKHYADDEFKQMQNTHRFHLCCSHYEGFGHYINEAKSCKSIIITTNGSPMNELITDEFGFGVAFTQYVQMRLAQKKIPNPNEIRKAVLDCMGMENDLLDECGERARESYLNNDKYFRETFLNTISDFIK